MYIIWAKAAWTVPYTCQSNKSSIYDPGKRNVCRGFFYGLQQPAGE